MSSLPADKPGRPRYVGGPEDSFRTSEPIPNPNPNQHPVGFTAGPWHRDFDHPTMITDKSFDEAKEIIAQTSCVQNARLIVVAPEMYEALVRAKQFIELGISSGYIRIPHMAPDTAHEMLQLILSVLEWVKHGTADGEILGDAGGNK